MGVLRDTRQPSDNGHGHVKATDGITVTCPKCRKKFTIREISADTPVRCSVCNYPMLLRGDIRQIISTCEKPGANQVNLAFSILRQMSEYVPEACPAMSTLVNRYGLTINEQERWNKLLGAYASGDDKARVCLDTMVQSSPETYTVSYCSHCGAPIYRVRGQQDNAACAYCQSTE